jgi:hypothetical protein
LSIFFPPSDEFYLFVSGKTIQEDTIDGLQAVLESPYFNYDGISTLSFWHRAAKKDTDLLKLLLVNEEFPASYKNIVIDTLDKVWKKAIVSFNTTNALQVSSESNRLFMQILQCLYHTEYSLILFFTDLIRRSFDGCSAIGSFR